ncbi:probable L-type lectin-domain containing receptor kinase S.7 [Amaranthus tricolor]|uniref:probable L-type lectin-domain containing receptor kinase S.7 n=1 Tax=Amaranthus tricolor TaxID=29722 RepID=UPI00258B6A4A|nr:probable L-type lectin-domain containing receptor kinase S.7 [Amaranthus tricolor]
MASIYFSRYYLLFFSVVFLICFPGLFLAQSSSSFGFKSFAKNSNFLNEIGFFGDTKLDENGSFVQITQSWGFSAGRMMYRKPITMGMNKLGRNIKASFGTYFSFSLSPENGDGLAFVMLPNGYSSDGYNGKLFGLSNELIQKKNRAFFAVEIDTKMDNQFGDLDGNHVGINIGSLVSVKVSNSSELNLDLSSGKKLQCWIDYEASSKRFEIRMSKADETRPVSPLLSCPIDLFEMFKGQDVFIGLSSSNANSTQVCKVFSWSFKLRQVPYWMHSQPLDPQTVPKDVKPVTIRQKTDCTVRVLTALIIGIACGALGAYTVMFVWSVFVTKQPVAPEEYVVKPAIYDYDKVKVLAVDACDDVK